MVGPRWRDPRLFPLAAGPLMCLLGLVEGSTDAAYRPHFAVLALVAFWLLAAFVVQARFPCVGAVLVVCFYPLSLILGAPGPGGTGLIAAMLAMGYVGYAAPARRSLVAVTVAVAVFVTTDVVVHGLAWDSVFFPAVFYPARWAGRLVRRERERSAELMEVTSLLEAQREQAAHAAAVEERTRIAREVHDAVAHSVSVMTLQTGGLRRQLAPVLADRPQEYDVLLGLERLGRQTVEELRSLVGILREPGDDQPAAAVPSLARASEVVQDVRAAGLDVDLEVTGEPRELPRALDASAYRILQEALTNVLRHAPGSRAHVVLDYGHDAVGIRVRDEGAPATNGERRRLPLGGGGHGLVGMRERAQVFGGTLRTRQTEQGFEVHAVLPTNRSWS
ncbi:sensor histidine kinase [Nocardioides mesophilus]|uniref:histidine kinase n=1 Tax=Nocardioides mesophilus TaxID=433659 RepID=A0A7G9R8U3_9ACTN|nr:histidine kinase [Nocardioides mesophilus]QNN52018.1 sensor histidine kinase [Nocardioides mesophilus]